MSAGSLRRQQLRRQGITYLVAGIATAAFMALYLAPHAAAERRALATAKLRGDDAAALPDGGSAAAAPTPASAAEPVEPSGQPGAPAQPSAAALDGDAAGGATDGPDRAPTVAGVAAQDEAPRGAPPPAEPTTATAPLPAPLLVRYFSTGRAALTQGQMAVIRRAAQALRRDPSLRALVRGHADRRGSDQENTPLSAQRAEAVASALRHLDIAEDRIEAVGVGSQSPLDQADTQSAFAANRRVEIVFLRKDPP